MQDSSSHSSVSPLWDHLLPLLLGVAAFLVVLGPAPLKVSNIAWLVGSDPSQHYLGWAFYRQSPWGFPIGVNPGFGLELGSSIFYSDSIPLLAFLFKPFAPLLPQTFQYLGLWFLLCFMLQGWIAWRLVGLVSQELTPRLLATCFFLFSPPMLWMLHGHEALFGHWLILGALYLCLAVSLPRRHLSWSLLTVAASLVHSYLLPMVLGLWFSDLSRRLVTRENGIPAALREGALILAGVLIALWQAGFFVLKSGFGGKGGYGYYSLNLLSLINPAASGFVPQRDHWSYLLPGLPHLEGTGDLLFLGSGVLLMALLAAPRALGPLRSLQLWPRWAPLLLLFGALTLFAVSNNVAIGTAEFKLPIPAFLLGLAQSLRCSARMFWPVYYFIYLALIYLVLTGYGKKAAVGILAALLLLQVADTSSGWLPIREKHAKVAATWPTPFASTFWQAAAQRYRKVRVVPPGDNPRFAEIAYFAAGHGLQTDTAYLARYDTASREKALRKAEQSVVAGTYDDDSLYLIDASYLDRALASVQADEDLVARIDGFFVVAPKWKLCKDCPQPAPLSDKGAASLH